MALHRKEFILDGEIKNKTCEEGKEESSTWLLWWSWHEAQSSGQSGNATLEPPHAVCRQHSITARARAVESGKPGHKSQLQHLAEWP